jgi:rubrerythrin
VLSVIPVSLIGLSGDEINREVLRAAIIAELDAVNLYEQMASMTNDKNIKAVLLDIAREEKTHVGEFQAMLLRFDKEQEKELEEGKEEIEELVGKNS